MLIKIGLRDLSRADGRLDADRAGGRRAGAAGRRRSGALGTVRGRSWDRGRWSGRCRWPRPFLLIALGEQEISSALAGILVATAPIFTAVLAIWVDHEERSEGVRLLGIVIGIAGVVVLFGLDLSGSGSAVVGGLAIVLGGPRVCGGRLPGQAPAWRRAADRGRRLGDGGEHGLAAAGGARHGAELGSGPRPGGRGRGAGGGRDGDRVRDLLRPDRPGGAGALVHRRLPGARGSRSSTAPSCSASRSPSPRSPGWR